MSNDGLYEKLRSCISDHKNALIQEKLKVRSRYVSFVFEQLYHDHNIDAAMRSIEACGFQDVHCIEQDKKRVHGSGTITKGSDYWLTEYRYNQPDMNTTQMCFDALRAQGYRLIGTSPHNTSSMMYTPEQIPLGTKIAVIFGNERSGLSEYALSQLDACMRIPLYGFTESFNVSVSAAVVAYELRKRLQQHAYDTGLTQQEKFDLELSWLKRLVQSPEAGYE